MIVDNEYMIREEVINLYMDKGTTTFIIIVDFVDKKTKKLNSGSIDFTVPIDYSNYVAENLLSVLRDFSMRNNLVFISFLVGRLNEKSKKAKFKVNFKVNGKKNEFLTDEFKECLLSLFEDLGMFEC